MTEQKPDEGSASEGTPEVTGLEDAEALAQALDKETARAEANLAGWQRAQADYINYRRRSEQEKEEVVKFANTVLVLSLLPILDDWERAFAAIPPELAGADWVDGIRLIDRKLRATLEAQGLTQIEALGETFDPNLHEAVRQDSGREGIVVGEVEKGYKFRDRVIRPAKVVVGNGQEGGADNG